MRPSNGPTHHIQNMDQLQPSTMCFCRRPSSRQCVAPLPWGPLVCLRQSVSSSSSATFFPLPFLLCLFSFRRPNPGPTRQSSHTQQLLPQPYSERSAILISLILRSSISAACSNARMAGPDFNPCSASCTCPRTVILRLIIRLDKSVLSLPCCLRHHLNELVILFGEGFLQTHDLVQS